MQAQAALSTQLVVARQQHADVCMQLQKEHAALQQAAVQEHTLQKVRQHSVLANFHHGLLSRALWLWRMSQHTVITHCVLSD